jgi:acetylornithine deacetylase/succinyl-diaminopimelate desuccinylase-like protein
VNKSVRRESASDADFARGGPRKWRKTRPSRARRSARAWKQGLFVALAAQLALAGAVRAGARGTDWRALGEETADLLADLIRMDTSNPPGAEVAAANALARKLRADGVDAQVLESAPGRGNLYARLPGRGGARAVILLSHLDVVPADGRGWRLPPFGGVREPGWVNGRGALDCKGVAAVQAMTLLALKRRGVALDRDLILLATADEETGGRAGAGWLVEHRPDLLGDAEFLLTEGDHVHLRPSASGALVKVVQVAVAEKTPCWVRLVARGEPGHGSVPPAQTAVTRLVRALNKLRRYRTAVHLTRPVEEYFAAIAPLQPAPMREHLRHLARALEDPAFTAEFTRNSLQNALVRNTITPTVLQAGVKTNVIPADAAAELDCRLLPGERPADFLALLRDVIGDDSIRIEPLLSFPSSSSDSNSALVAAVRRMAATMLGAPVVPSVIPGFTDSHYFRERGIASYGFVPFILADDDEKAVHGVNERISVENLRGGVERLSELLRTLGSSGRR